MISSLSIENYKSVKKLDLKLGRITVLIGENGCGKSNILESIALLAGALSNKLDNQFLVSRGIRISESDLMISAFPQDEEDKSPSQNVVKLKAISGKKKKISLELSPQPTCWKDTTPSLKFNAEISRDPPISEEEPPKEIISQGETAEALAQAILSQVKPTITTKEEGGLSITFGPVAVSDDISEQISDEAIKLLSDRMKLAFESFHRANIEKDLQCGRFVIYAPENSALRKFEEEGQNEPVGVRGEGLFKMLQTLSHNDYSDRLKALKESLELVGWFFDFCVPPDLSPGEYRLRIYDRFLGNTVPFDQRSANEGFLFLLFYFAVFLSPTTPPFFAIDNIDASLNPKLCTELMRRLCILAKQFNKQVIVTTHNPAILDGLNLLDDDQVLHSVYRNDEGQTKARRIQAPQPMPGEAPVKLSQAFLQGLIGGLPKNF